jgi:hypothetical protein
VWLDLELCNVHGTPGARYGGTYPGTSPGPVTLRPDPVPLRAMSGPFLLSGRCRIIPTTATIYPIGWVRSNPPAATPQLSTGNPRDAAVRTQQCSCSGTRPSSGSGRPPRHDHTVLTAKHGHPSAIPHTKWASRTARHIRSTTSPRPRVCGGAPGLLHPLSYKATIRPIRPRFLSIDSH